MDDIRFLIKVKGLKGYEVAEETGISTPTLYVWLRKYDAEHHKRLLDAITRLSGGESDDEIN